MDTDYVLRAEYAIQLQRVEDEERRQNKRIEKVEEKVEHLNDLVVSINKLATSVEAMSAELKNQGRRLESIEKVPGNRWNELIKTAVTVLGTAAITYFLSH